MCILGVAILIILGERASHCMVVICMLLTTCFEIIDKNKKKT